MTIAYFDCAAGISGDMVLASLLDAGLPLAKLKKDLQALDIGRYQLVFQKNINQLKVKIPKQSAFRNYQDIKKLLKNSRLNKQVKEISQDIFHNLAWAEAKVHKIAVDKVHFHEVGAVDSIVDIVGSAIALAYFNFKQIYASALPLTSGTIECEHGVLPVPAPATMELLKKALLEKCSVKGEIVTPTGAAIITTIAHNFGDCPLQKVEKIGYGRGSQEFRGIPNALRLLIGQGYPVVVIEANIDDMNPQVFDYVMEQALNVGAVDVALVPIQMKKNRPAIMLQCQAPWHLKDKIIDVILKETTTIGVRYYPVERKILFRELKTQKTKFGNVRVKIAYDQNGQIIKRLPEYDDLKKIAKKTKHPISRLMQEVCRKY
ncbi:MAG: nickel pincer cofactor biosynthesis protein LarC [Pseudomonadota bacterium]